MIILILPDKILQVKVKNWRNVFPHKANFFLDFLDTVYENGAKSGTKCDQIRYEDSKQGSKRPPMIGCRIDSYIGRRPRGCYRLHLRPGDKRTCNYDFFVHAKRGVEMKKRGGGRKNRENIFECFSQFCSFPSFFSEGSLFKTSKTIIVIDKKLQKKFPVLDFH
jgi:hypothetical protein